MTTTQEHFSNLENSSNKSQVSTTALFTSSIDKEIDRARKHFYGVLMNKRRHIRRNFLQMSVIANEHMLETLSYRTMLTPPVENYGSPEQWQKDDDEGIGTKSTLKQRSNISDIPTENEEGIVPKISPLENDEQQEEIEQDPWLDSETDLEIQRILNEENKS